MRLSTAFILWRYILVDFWRLTGLTAAVLVVITAFAVAIKPLAEGVLGPLDTLKLMAMATGPMLQYTLPFAAGFGATLAYHRLCTDNELVACHAGGVSHRRILAPAVASGVLMTLVLLVLADQAIPSMLKRIDRAIRQDLARLIVRQIEDGRTLEFGAGRWVVHADEVALLDISGEDPDKQAIQLGGVLLIEFGKGEQVITECTADRAFVVIDHSPDDAASQDEVMVTVHAPEASGRYNGGPLSGRDLTKKELAPDQFRDDPKYLSWEAMRDLKRRPERMDFIETRRRVLAAHMIERRVTAHIADRLARTGFVDLVDGAGRPRRVSAGGINWDPSIHRWRLTPGPGGRIVVRTPTLEYVTRDVTLHTSTQPQVKGQEVVIDLTLRKTESRTADQAGDATTNQIEQWQFEGLELASRAGAELLEADSQTLLDLAAESPDDPFIQRPARELKKRLADLDREVMSKLHERAAMSVACLVMVLTGAIMAMRLRGATPLAVYMWAFFPALGAVLTISAGQQLTHQQGLLGLLVLWGGVIGLAAHSLTEYRLLRRH